MINEVLSLKSDKQTPEYFAYVNSKHYITKRDGQIVTCKCEVVGNLNFADAFNKPDEDNREFCDEEEYSEVTCL